jgi:hypothetical protein
MIIKSMNYEVATQEDSMIFLDADQFLNYIPSILIPAIRIAQNIGQNYVTVPETIEFEQDGLQVVEISWG